MASVSAREHVRVKRGKSTVFIAIDLEGGATGQALQEVAARVMDVTDLSNLRLLRESDYAVLLDNVPLADQDISNDDVVVAVLRQSDTDEWEAPDVVNPSPYTQRRDNFR